MYINICMHACIHAYICTHTYTYILEKKIYDLIVKTVISAEHSVVSKMNAFCNGAIYNVIYL